MPCPLTPPQVGAVVEMDEVGMRFGDRTVTEGISLCMEPGEVVCVVGPSGCGRTTLPPSPTPTSPFPC